MRSRSGLWVFVCTWVLLGACGPGTVEEPGGLEEISLLLPEPAPSPPVTPEPEVMPPAPPREPQAPPEQPSPPAEPPTPAPAFQPAFHQALRWSRSVSTLTTYRLRVPVGWAGERLRVTFRSGDGSLSLQKATVARAGPHGALASEPVTLTFSGSPAFSVGARTRITSDPVVLPVRFREELAVSFEVRGALSVSAIDAFPGSFVRSGAYASVRDALGGQPSQRAIGVATIEVEGTPGRAFVALGDSITEGYIDTYNDTRKAWPALVEERIGRPVLNAGVSGQGFYGALEKLDQEVLALSGVTDCLILLGTNDLSASSLAELQSRMTRLLDRLRPFCRTWVSTLLPKEKTNYGDYEVVKRDRLAFNAWIRQQTKARVIDLEAVTRQPSNVHLFIEGLEVDGIHPSARGHQIMAAEVERVLRAGGL
jgi:lysophospholipase L1-like esterase